MKARYLILLVTSFATAAWGNPQVYFSPGGVQSHLVSAIDHSSQTLDLAVYELSAKRLVEALKHAAERGVIIRIILDEKVLREHAKDKELARMPHITLRTLSGREPHRGMMHNKFAIFDESRLVTGSYNWSEGAELANYENVIFENDLETVRLYSGQFADLWSRSKPVRPSFDLSKPSHHKHHYH